MRSNLRVVLLMFSIWITNQAVVQGSNFFLDYQLKIKTLIAVMHLGSEFHQAEKEFSNLTGKALAEKVCEQLQRKADDETLDLACDMKKDDQWKTFEESVGFSKPFGPNGSDLLKAFDSNPKLKERAQQFINTVSKLGPEHFIPESVIVKKDPMPKSDVVSSETKTIEDLKKEVLELLPKSVAEQYQAIKRGEAKLEDYSGSNYFLLYTAMQADKIMNGKDSVSKKDNKN